VVDCWYPSSGSCGSANVTAFLRLAVFDASNQADLLALQGCHALALAGTSFVTEQLEAWMMPCCLSQAGCVLKYPPSCQQIPI
jgi:hypothetical protein